MAKRRMQLSPIDRFWANVYVNPDTGCWEWERERGFFDGTKTVAVHRYAWSEIAKKDLISGQRLRRTCGNKLCISPEHFELETSTQRQALLRSNVRSPKIKGNEVELLTCIIQALHQAPNLKLAYKRTASKYTEKLSAINKLGEENSHFILWCVARQRVLGRMLSDTVIPILYRQKDRGLACNEFTDSSIRGFLTPKTTRIVFGGRPPKGGRDTLIADYQRINAIIGKLQYWFYRPQATGIEIEELSRVLSTRCEVLRAAALALKIPVTKSNLNIEKII